MAGAIIYKAPELNWDATDLADQLSKFRQYCNLNFTGPYSKKSEKEKLVHFTVDWQAKARLLQQLGLGQRTTKRTKKNLRKSGSAAKNTSPRK